MVKTKFITILMAIVFAFSGTCVTVNAQQISEQAKKAAKAKVTKEAKKEAKRLKKEGWNVTPGGIPIERQLDRAFGLQYEITDDNLPKYIIGTGMSVAEAYDAAKMQATEIAKQDLAAKTQSELTSEIKSTVANNQLSPDEAASVVEVINASRSLITQSIGRVITITEVYRYKENKNVEVLIRVAYDSENIKKAAKQAIRNDLRKRGNEMHKKLEEYGWN
ncbi:MAG: hypothetical protein II235_01285 [Muribaculaceae bacterium]|nr:hypothetical protein [Muribaculaceae bacterium]MEE1297710.1 hypothetical protein [Muribaculaceae bacterium]